MKVTPDNVLEPVHHMARPYGACGHDIRTEGGCFVKRAVKVQRSAHADRNAGKPLKTFGIGGGFPEIKTGVVMPEAKAQGIQRLMETVKGAVGRDGDDLVDKCGIVHQGNGGGWHHQGHACIGATGAQQSHRRRRHEHITHVAIVYDENIAQHVYFLAFFRMILR